MDPQKPPVGEPWPFDDDGPEPQRAPEGYPPSTAYDPEHTFRLGSPQVRSIDDGPLGPALDGLQDSHPLEVALRKHFFDDVLLPKTREALRVWQSALLRQAEHNAAARQVNAPILATIKRLEDKKDALTAKRLDQIAEHAKAKAKALEACAKALGEARRFLDPERLIPKLPDPLQVRSVAAIAAELKAPYTEHEAALHLGRLWDYGLSVVIGSLTGVAYVVAARLTTSDALMENPLAGAAVALLGTAFTVAGGLSVKYAWRLVAEAYYSGSYWTARGVGALAWTLACVAIDAAVCVRGLMASSALHAQVARIGGAIVSGDDTAAVTALLCGAAATLFYLGHAAFRGFLKDRSGARNRIVEAQENERLDLIREATKADAWPGVVAAVNGVVALDVIDKANADAFKQASALLAQRADELKGQLVALWETPSEWDQARHRAAVDGVNGHYGIWLRSMDALKRGCLGFAPPARRIATRRVWERLKSFFTKRQDQPGGV